MTRFIDKESNILEISMLDRRTRCPFERDFYNVGTLEYNDDIRAYIVANIFYLIETAKNTLRKTLIAL